MKTLLLGLLLGAALGAQTIGFYIDSSSGGLPVSQLTPLPSTYQFPDTPVGAGASVVIRVVNLSTSDVTIDAIFIGASPASSVATPNFTITGWQTGGAKIAPQGFKLFTLNFTPASAGVASGYLQAQVDENPTPLAVATVQGNGIASVLRLTCQDAYAAQCDGKTTLQPNSSTPITFGPPDVGVAVGYGYQITFTFTNQSSVAVTTPTVSLQNANPTSAFSLSTYALPSSIAPNSTGSFTVTFAPQANGSPNFQASLIVGSSSNVYPLMGIVATPAVQVKCTDKTGAGCQMSGSTIPLGPDPNTLTLTFQVINSNPLGTSFADISLPTPPSIVGSGFTITAPTLAESNTTSPGSPVQAGQSVTIHPGWTLSFQVTFNGTQAESGRLTIPGVITYTLNAQPLPQLGSVQSDLPGITFMCGSSPCMGQAFTSQQQVHATLQLSKPSTGSATLALSFSPLVKGITDDPAVTFISPFNTRNLGPISFSQSSVTGSFAGGGSQFTFQTGTTAGTLTFTLTDSLTQQTLNWAIDVPPAQVHITSGQAVREGTNLVVTLTGYDNTYSAGQLSFAFSTTTAGTITVPFDATSNFHQYFFSNNQAGGAFALQASFPVAGDPAQIGSVAVTLSNSAGPTSTTETFQ
jgi:hypothetical protein